jgi:hypothetical protein
MLSVRSLERCITINSNKILIAAKKFFYGEFFSPAGVQRPWVLTCFCLIWIKFVVFRQIAISSFAEICPVVSQLIHAEYRKEGHDEAKRHFSRLYEDNNDEKLELRQRRFPFQLPV